MAERKHMEEEIRLEMQRGRRPPTVNDWLESERARTINRGSARERKPVRPAVPLVALTLPIVLTLPILLSLALRWCCHVAIEGMDQ